MQAQPQGPTGWTIVVNGRFLGQRTTGVQRVAREVAGMLDRLVGEGAYPGLEVRLVAPSGTREAFESLGTRYLELVEAFGGFGHMWEQCVLPRHVGSADLLCLGNSAPITTLYSSRRTAVMLHDQSYRLFPSDYSRAYRWMHHAIETAILQRAAPLILVSEAERANLAARHPREAARAIVAPNGSWAADGAVGSQSGQTDRYGLFVGSPTARKNIDSAIAVAIRLARTHGVRFRFVGPTMQRLSDRIPADVRQLIELIGYAPDAAMPSLYGEAAFLLYPSLYEASGLPPSEAMTFGCPVVASDLPVMRERCGDAAVYFDPDSEDAIYSAVEQVLRDDALRARLRAAGRERAQSFTWRRQTRIIVDAMLRVRAAAAPSARDGIAA